jgi:hypothetical protein
MNKTEIDFNGMSTQKHLRRGDSQQSDKRLIMNKIESSSKNHQSEY